MAMNEMSDAELCGQWSAGNQDAGGELLERHLPSVERFFRNKVFEDYDDLVQQTFATAIEARTRFRGDSSFRTFLFGIAHNVLRRHVRDRMSDKVVLEEVTAVDLNRGPSTIMREGQEHRLLVEALQRIPVDYQVIFELRYWEELPVSTIATIVGVADNTVRNRLARGRELLDVQLTACARSRAELDRTVKALAHLEASDVERAG